MQNKRGTRLCMLALGSLIAPILASAQTEALTTAFFELHHVAPRSTARLRATIIGKTISTKSLKTGAVEWVYYGANRVDAKGEKSRYRIHDSGIEEEHDGEPRMLLIYDWQGHAYVCLENVGDLDVLDDAEGTCPYEIVSAAEGNHIHGT